MEDRKVKDLTVGSPLKLIVGFSIPIFLGMMFQQFYSFMDTMIVGQTLGVNALAAVGSTGSVTFLILGFCNGIASGFAIPVAQRFGAKDEKGLKLAIANGVYMGIILSVVVTLIVTALCRPILEFLNTPTDIIDGAYSYLIVVLWGIPVIFFYNLFSGIMRSLGDSRTPVYFLVAASVLNIVLDYAFILGLGTGVEGAAYATVISQFVAAFFSGIYMLKKYAVVHMTKYERRWDFQCVMQLMYMGVPMGMQYSITAIGAVILQTAVNGLGSDAVASVTAGGKIACFFLVLFDALGSTMATYSGQNMGAKRLDRVSKGLYISCAIGMIYSIFAGAFLAMFGHKFALLFVDATERTVISNVALYLQIESGFYILLTLVNCIRFTIQGMGFSFLAVVAGVMEMVARVFVAVVCVPLFGYAGACLASPVAWILADAFLIPAFFHVRKKVKMSFEKVDIAVQM